jgi:hypothetical protein
MTRTDVYLGAVPAEKLIWEGGSTLVAWNEDISDQLRLFGRDLIIV